VTYTVSNSKVKIIQNSHMKSFPAFVILTFPFILRFLPLFIEIALTLQSETDSYTYHKIFKNGFPPAPLSFPTKSSTDRLQSLQHSYKREDTVKALTGTCWNSQFPPSSLVWPSLLLPNPKTYAIILKSLVVKSSSCQAANYSLMQKAEAAKTKRNSTQCKLGSIPLLHPVPRFWRFLLLLVQLSKGHIQRKCL